ncbi:MAG TPA: hypothetical protein PLU73_11645, partial [Bacteroidia bacterium]|nr:hypothetical protein [Bacteroidia bacterium]
MARFVSLFQEYRQLEKSVLNVIISEFFIQMVNATFMNILPLYMLREGFSNEEIAMFITFRFIGVFILAIPMGKFIRGKKLLPLFYVSNICVPVFGIAIVFAIAFKLKILTIISLLLWGASFTFMQIPIAPFVLRNSSPLHHTAGISLSYSTWSFGGIISGILIAVLDLIDPVFFNEKLILLLFSIIGLGGIFFLNKI